MTELMQQILARKRARRKALAALPVGDKLRMLDEMMAETRAIVATHPPKPANPVRLRQSQAMESIPTSVLDEAVERLVREFQPEEIYLFGSYVWGTPTANSDLDFFVIVPDTNERPIRRAQRGHRCLRGLAKPKDVLVHTRSEVDRFKHLRASLSHQILQRGRKLYG